MAKKEDKVVEMPLEVVDVPAPVVEVVAPPVTLSFDRYFLTLGKPMHHKKGMIAFVKSVNGKKTLEAWDALFQGY